MRTRTARFLATFVPALLLIAVALSFSTAVNIGAFRRDSSDALFSTFGVAGRKVVSSIEHAVKYGKSIDNFFGMERTLGQLQSYLPQVNGVAVALPDGEVIHAVGTYAFKDQIGDRLTGYERRRTAAEFASAPSFHYHDTDNRAHKLFLPIRNPDDGAWIGTLVIAAADAVVDEHARDFEEQSLIFAGGLGALAVVLLGLLALRPREEGNGRTALVIAAVLQVALGVKGYAYFGDAYRHTVERSTQIVENIIATDFATVVNRGATYRSYTGVDSYFRDIIGFVPHIKRIALDLPDGVRAAGPTSHGAAAGMDDPVSARPLASDADLVTPTLRIVTDGRHILKSLFNVIVNNVTILIISLMLLYELHLIASRGLRRPDDGPAAAVARSVAGMRFLTFTLYFGLFLSASFVPVVMQTFDQGFLGLPPMQAAAAPVSVEMLFGAAAILVAGRLGGRRGWRVQTACGLTAACVGAAVSGLADHPVLFVAARGLVGAGAMLVLMGVYRLIEQLRRIDPETGAYSDMFSGMYVGVNCGAVAGSLLADEIGARAVFLIAAAILAGGLLQLALVLRGAGREADAVQPAVAAPAPTPAIADGRRRPVWGDLSFVAFLLLVSVPTSACSMFLIYYFPLFASGLGQPASTVGQAFLLYGLCIVYLGPVLSRAMRTSGVNPALPVLVSGLIMAGGLVAFALTGNLFGAFLAILLLGLSDSFGLSAQQRYLEGLPVVRVHGLAVPQSYHLNARKIGQVIGPMLFSAAALAGATGATIISVGLAAALTLHLLVSLWAVRQRPTLSEAT